MGTSHWFRLSAAENLSRNPYSTTMRGFRRKKNPHHLYEASRGEGNVHSPTTEWHPLNTFGRETLPVPYSSHTYNSSLTFRWKTSVWRHLLSSSKTFLLLNLSFRYVRVTTSLDRCEQLYIFNNVYLQLYTFDRDWATYDWCKRKIHSTRNSI